MNKEVIQPSAFVLHGDICYSESPRALRCLTDGYLVCVGGESQGAYETLPEQFENLPLFDYTGRLILPGLTDLHTHAPQVAFRGLGMDMTLLDWLEAYTYPEEAKYADYVYAERAYAVVARDLVMGPNTRVCLFATVHTHATRLLMDLLEATGLKCMVGKVSMDRNCPAYLCEDSAARAAADARRWLEESIGRYQNITPILTPRFIPTCSDELLRALAALRQEFHAPVQSHLSENRSEADWVSRLCPDSRSYGDACARRGLFDGEKTVMAHCVLTDDGEMELLRQHGVFLAHCPQSNTNLSSGIAPVRRFLDHGLSVGLGSDVAGGCHLSIFRAMADAIQASKLRRLYADTGDAPLTVNEAFYLGTRGGGAFFGKVGSFDPGYEFDALVIDDDDLGAPFPLGLEERLARVVYFSDDRHIRQKYVSGRPVRIDD